jgi:Chaperone of endosialidase
MKKQTITNSIRKFLAGPAVRRGFPLTALALASFALSPTARAVDPAPDGGYPNGNTAEGDSALLDLTTGEYNTAVGAGALLSTTTGYSNTATGFEALEYNTTSSGNTADGFSALANNTTGSYNTAIGNDALAFNATGSENTAIGDGAMNQNNTGSGNIAIGKIAGLKITSGNNNIDIGNQGVAGESSTIRIGGKTVHKNTYIAGINGVTVAGGVGVVIDSLGHLGTITSSERYKDAIQPMDKASEAILALRPVTFRYKRELDPAGIPQFGLVAEQVEKVNPDLVARDEAGKPYTVRYEAVNAMLLNEFLKEHQKVEEQNGKIGEQAGLLKAQDGKLEKLEATVTQLQLTLAEQAARIQKVSEQLAVGQSGPRVAANRQ